jgi:hypothetical protein
MLAHSGREEFLHAYDVQMERLDWRKSYLNHGHVEWIIGVAVLRPGTVVEFWPKAVQEPSFCRFDSWPSAALFAVTEGTGPFLPRKTIPRFVSANFKQSIVIMFQLEIVCFAFTDTWW